MKRKNQPTNKIERKASKKEKSIRLRLLYILTPQNNDYPPKQGIFRFDLFLFLVEKTYLHFPKKYQKKNSPAW